MTKNPRIPRYPSASTEEELERYKILFGISSDYAYALKVIHYRKNSKATPTITEEWFTRSFKKVTGYLPEEITDQGGLPGVVHKDDHHLLMERRKILLSGKPFSGAFRIVDPQGNIRWVHESSCPVIDPKTKRIIRIYAAGHSIDAEKKAEEQLKHQQKDLEQKLKTRTQELQEAYAKKTQFLAEIAHELRTPLAIAGHNIELALGKKSREHTNPYHTLQKVQHTLINITTIIQQFISLSEAEYHTNTQASMHSLRIDTLIKENVQRFNSLFSDGKITFQLHHIDKASVYGRRDDIEKVITNIFSNAIKYAKPDGTHISVSLRAHKKNTTLTIKDTGIGIRIKDLKYIFEPFYRVEDSPQSSGLGLAICKNVIEDHGGTITAKSIYGKGSTFKISLPLYTSQKNSSHNKRT